MDVHSSNNCMSEYVEPCCGQRFKTLEDVEKHYQGYAKQQGFEVKIRTSRKHARTGETCSVLYTCKRQGNPSSKVINLEDENVDKKKQKRVRDIIEKTNCEARLFVTHQIKEDEWLVTSYESKHNHPFVSPQKRGLIQTHKNITPVTTSLVEVFDHANLGVNKMMNVFKTQAGGLQNVPFTDRNIRNTLRDIRSKEVIEQDAKETLLFLHKLSASGGQKFFTYRLDDDNHIDILLWIDGRSRLAYQSFGDVVTFDTTYRTNKFGLPFAPFTGINHHYHSIVFGFGLIRQENEESFTWLFNRWLEAMNNVPPKTILTDQDKAMVNAIAKVFPDTYHAFCIWHITKKYPSYLNSLYFSHPTFKTELDACVHKTLTIEEFENSWSKLVCDYNLGDHEWLQSLYRMREKWIPAYTKRFFAAGMTSTQRSESMNSKFNKAVNSHTSMTDFVKKSIEIVDEDFLREKLADFHTSSKSRNILYGSPLESHAAKIYTKDVFRQFQQEISKINELTHAKERAQCTENIKVYFVWNANKAKYRTYKVTLHTDGGQLRCSCLLFDHKGLVCKHMLHMFIAKGVTEIPTSMVLRRWTKDANKFNGKEIWDSPSKPIDFEESQVMRYNHLAQVLNGVAAEASCSKEAYRYVMELLEREGSKINSLAAATGMKSQCSDTEVKETQESDEVLSETQVQSHIEDVLDPIAPQTKGRKRQPRIKSGIELANKKNTRKCSICKSTTHDARNHEKFTKGEI